MRENKWNAEREHGFTLVELMVVIAVIAVLAATAIPGITSWLPNYRLKSVARGVYSQFQEAKLEAVRNDADCVVFFDQVNNRCEVIRDFGADGVLGTADDDVISQFILGNYGSNVTFGTGNATKQVDDAAFGANPWDYNYTFALFNNRGMVFDRGYVYISNDQGTTFAIGTPTFAGSIRMLKWYDNGVWQ